MIKLTINLPGIRLHFGLAKRRGAAVDDPILPTLKDIRSVRNGDKLSRFFRHIFEHKNIRRILGSNLALILVVSTIIPASASAYSPEVSSETVVITAPQNMETEAGIHYPLDTFKVNQRFNFFHPGVDFGAKKGQAVYPIMAGKVIQAGWDKTGYGNKIVIAHGDGLETLYAHLSKINVKIGTDVMPSTKIGEVGSTGHSTGNHLHLEISKNQVRQNPLNFLPKVN